MRGVTYGLANRCSHCGGSLAEGQVIAESIQCPLSAPASASVTVRSSGAPALIHNPVFDVRERGAGIEVRARER
jgi:nitrite reductase/ring-hydroxylating ferredoxin subunit